MISLNQLTNACFRITLNKANSFLGFDRVFGSKGVSEWDLGKGLTSMGASRSVKREWISLESRVLGVFRGLALLKGDRGDKGNASEAKSRRVWERESSWSSRK